MAPRTETTAINMLIFFTMGLSDKRSCVVVIGMKFSMCSHTCSRRQRDGFSGRVSVNTRTLKGVHVERQFEVIENTGETAGRRRCGFCEIEGTKEYGELS